MNEERNHNMLLLFIVMLIALLVASSCHDRIEVTRTKDSVIKIEKSIILIEERLNK